MISNYLKTLIRIFYRNKLFSLINIFGLTLGLTCFILIFLWIKDEVSYDRFHENYQNIYRLTVESPNSGRVFKAAVGPAPMAIAIKEQIPEVKEYTRFRPLTGEFLVETNSKKNYEKSIAFADSTFFNVFSFKFLQGDPNTALNNLNKIIITKSAAQKYFGSENPIGKNIKIRSGSINANVSAVIEDIPQNSHLSFDFLLWIENFSGKTNMSWGNFYFNSYYLFQEGTDVSTLEEAATNIFTAQQPENAELNMKFLFQALKDIHLKSDYDIDLNNEVSHKDYNVQVFSIVAIFILIIACINFMNLSTARAIRRAKEVGIRKVAGANRSKLIRQFFFESILHVVIALIFSIILVEIVLPYFNNFTNKTLALHGENSLILYLILIFVTFITGVFAGSYPAFYLSSFKPIEVLKSNLIHNKSSVDIRKILVIFQFLLSVILISGTLIISLQRDFIQKKDLGLNYNDIVYMKIRGDINNRFETFKKELENNSNIIQVTRSSDIPTNTIHLWGGVSWEEKQKEDVDQMYVYTVGYDFLKLFDINLAQGRFFENPTDSGNYIINETAARIMSLDDPIGKEMSLGDSKGSIIGVLQDFNFKSIHKKIEPLIMRSSDYYSFIIVKYQANTKTEAIRTCQLKWEELNPDYPFEYHLLENDYDKMYEKEEKTNSTFVIFACLAVIISCLGLFGLATYLAESKTKEIGVRKVLGSSIQNLMYRFNSIFIKWVVLANIIAIPISWFAMKSWLENFAYHITMSFWIFVIAALITILITLFTVSYITYKAASSDPLNALKYE